MKPPFVIAVLLALAPLSFAQEKIDATKIVGTWELVKPAEGSAPAGTLVTFTKDGKLSLKMVVDGKEIMEEGTYKIQNDKLLTEIKSDGVTMPESDIIKKLTDDELVLEDDKAKVNILRRKK
jgi:uncharacterized protein (TIGR03066 family)